jgi:pimeloyl-ACP methyl ester carboxylesterase
MPQVTVGWQIQPRPAAHDHRIHEGRQPFMHIPTVPRLTGPRLAAAGVSLAIAGTLLGAGLAGSATAATAATGASTATTARHAPSSSAAAAAKPTIVLVHGAWADSSSWNGVIERLQALGYTVDAPPNPLSGVSSDSAYLSDFLSTISGPIILVGHSYGGAVITNAATGDKQVKALVYVDAFLPAKGQTLGELVTNKPGSCVVNPSNLTFAPFPGAPKGVVDAYVKQSVFPSCMANGLPASEARVLAATQRPLSTIALTQKSGVPAWKTIPSWAVIGTADHAIPPAELILMAKNAGAHITLVKGAPHLSMISNPGVVTRVILQAVRATS